MILWLLRWNSYEDGKALFPALNQLEIRWCLSYIWTILKETDGIWVLLFLVYQQYLTAFWELKEINIQSAPNSYLHFKILLTSHKYSCLHQSCSWRQCFLYNVFVFSVGVCDGEAGTLMSLNGLLKNWKVNAGITSSANQDKQLDINMKYSRLGKCIHCILIKTLGRSINLNVAWKQACHSCILWGKMLHAVECRGELGLW